MEKHRVWVEIASLVTAAACVLALLLATLGAGAAAAINVNANAGEQGNSTQNEESYEGMVTCSRCGAKHSAALERTATNCTRICVHAGASFELVQGESTYLLEGDLQALKRVAGERTRILGIRNGNTIKVTSVIPNAS